MYIWREITRISRGEAGYWSCFVISKITPIISTRYRLSFLAFCGVLFLYTCFRLSLKPRIYPCGCNNPDVAAAIFLPSLLLSPPSSVHSKTICTDIAFLTIEVYSWIQNNHKKKTSTPRKHFCLSVGFPFLTFYPPTSIYPHACTEISEIYQTNMYYNIVSPEDLTFLLKTARNDNVYHMRCWYCTRTGCPATRGLGALGAACP